ncbi:probable protein phosphatase 2c bipp2c1 [Phtheirospermum japonicum]|uniref:Protein phosphatase n=1 Tax=Phtheirospermum japonicum TaxID=374723 RepID=A0A830CI55_9LAMI|nr:probable protein phosphatase 2c bipp2c1 [Phtheirospermum japonicum]
MIFYFFIPNLAEHSDGSLFFRFGEPSEVAKNVKIEEAKPYEEIKTEGEDGDSVAKVFNDDHEKEVIIVNSPAVEGENEIDHSGNVDEEYEDSSEGDTSVLDTSSEIASIIVNMEHVENAEECPGEAHKDPSPDMENNITTTLELPESREMKIEIIEGVRECLKGDVDSQAPQSEPALSVSEAIEEQNLQTGDLITESNESLKVLNTDENVLSGEILEAISVDELIAPKSTGAATQSQEPLMTNFVLSSGAALLPHPSKLASQRYGRSSNSKYNKFQVLTGGEDAYFMAGQTWLGVADGVGQWSLEGSNPGVYAQELVKNCKRLVSDSNGESVNNAVELLNLSVADTHAPGSSTVLIAQFDGQALHVANIGDSGFIIIRNGAVYKRSSRMQHAFHFPLRIERGDDPSSLAELYRVDLEEEDVIIAATDGLLDNLYDQEISSIEIAELLVTKAQEIGRSESARSPFADEARAAGFAKYGGGKLDDVAVIVSLVQRRSNTQTL